MRATEPSAAAAYTLPSTTAGEKEKMDALPIDWVQAGCTLRLCVNSTKGAGGLLGFLPLNKEQPPNTNTAPA
jgi:hypothetical protein